MADECDHRIARVADIVSVMSESGNRVLVKRGSCIIEVEYSIDKDGTAQDVIPKTDYKGCSAYYRGAIKTIKKFVFVKGEYITGCKYSFTYELIP